MTSLPRPGLGGAARRVIGAVAGTVVFLPVLAGCAAPGTGPTTPAGSTASALPATSAPAEADCVSAGTPTARPGEASRPGAGAPATTSPPPGPLTDEQRRAEEFRRQQAANDGFRQRGTLSPEAASGARSCAAEVRRSLNLLTAGGQDDPGQEAVRRAIVATGLTGVNVRPPGRLDLGPVDGLVFAGWTGQACVFGNVRAGDVVVEIGTRIADGGCLPAPS
ncbi:hypothetical protein [Micromonospora peucetia]|uniref:Uncharacterized protein n=1 Tax=Micromonospora peucetia TaxID=47871 RepID=A0A1C6UWV6_9ACTN|nr:hypothetical protein [Micromonospora peucetia]WSA34973.1 hypothetical protein OIE14_13445 [Micromonospora peucetia]SCL58527.1 hypothetical protein GA0070608_1996 [Micromonospora peucetia]